MKAKKSLGQNFLKSIPALNAIIKAGEISKEDIVLEIGPGRGILTKKLLEHAGLVIAVETDRELFQFLKNKFEKEIQNKKLILIEDDILNFDIGFVEDAFSQVLGKNQETIQKSTSDSALKKNKEGEANEAVLTFSNGDDAKQDILRKSTKLRSFKIIANIPYNITGAILKKFLTVEHQPERMILMVQHEVAKRIVSKKESILSISVKAYGEPKIIMKVPARYFSPAPKVDSAIIAINNISRSVFIKNGINEEKFWEIVKNGFAHKRKKLSGNLKKLISGEKLLKNNFKDKRAEELSLLDWIILAKN